MSNPAAARSGAASDPVVRAIEEVQTWDIYRSSADVRHFCADLKSKLAALAAARLACQQENEALKRELSFVGKSPYPPAGCVQEAQKKSRADLERAGYKPNDLQVAYRGYRDGKWNQPPLYDPKLTEMAIVDALVEQGGTTAWCGDGVGCVAQMIDAQAQRADAARGRPDRPPARSASVALQVARTSQTCVAARG